MQGLECICLLLAYKIKYPENFFMLRGNHECSSINRCFLGNEDFNTSALLTSMHYRRIYGFYDECKRRYSLKLWKVS